MDNVFFFVLWMHGYIWKKGGFLNKKPVARAKIFTQAEALDCLVLMPSVI